jgi:hypothetical protein
MHRRCGRCLQFGGWQEVGKIGSVPLMPIFEELGNDAL